MATRLKKAPEKNYKNYPSCHVRKWNVFRGKAQADNVYAQLKVSALETFEPLTV